MRLLELHLERFGHFTDRRIDFQADAPLIVVHGANEAGKSTALAAITDALFGFDRGSSPYNFLHPYPMMRIGCTVEGSDGKRLSFRRRRGNLNTLLDEDDHPLSDDTLAPFLGNVDRALFLDAFGLTQQRLRDGAHRLIEGQGDIGQSLLAAAPGLSNLVELRASLAEEADALFPSGRKVASRPFYLACERYQQARRQVRELAVSIETVKATRLTLSTATERLDEVQASRRRNREEKTRLERLKTVLPGLDRIVQIRSEMTSLGDLPNVPADFIERCTSALEQDRSLGEERQRLGRELTGIETELGTVVVDEGVIEKEELIARLGDARANVLKSREDLPKRDGEIAGFNRQLDTAASRLGLADREAVLKRQPSDAELSRCRHLVTLKRRFIDERGNRSKELERVRNDIQASESERAKLGHVADPSPLRQSRDQLEGLALRIEEQDRLERQVEAHQRKIAEGLARLVVPAESAEALARLPVPDAGTIDGVAAQIEDLDRRAEKTREELERHKETAEGLEREIAAAADEGELATPDTVNKARAERDTHWHLLRSRLLGEGADVDPLSEVPTYEGAIASADSFADRRSAEAERVAQFQQLQRQRAETLSQIEKTETQLRSVIDLREAAVRNWVALWQAARIEPREPTAMRAWIDARTQILDLREDGEEQRGQLEQLKALITGQLTKLDDLAGRLNVAPAGLDPVALLEAVKTAADRQTERFQEARLLTQKLDGLQETQAKIEREVGKLDQDEETWRTEWTEATSSLGIRIAAEPDEADDVLAAWGSVPQIAASLDDLTHRVERMREDDAHFEQAVQDLCAAVATDLTTSPATDAIANLRERLRTAHIAATRRDEITKAFEQNKARQGDLKLERDENSTAVARLVGEASLQDAEALPDLLGRLGQGNKLTDALSKEQADLSVLSNGIAEDQLRAELCEIRADALIVRLQELAEDEIRLDSQFSDAVREEERATAALKEIEAQDGGAGAAQDEQTALADIAGIVERWTQTAAAEQLLGAAIESYRSRHQSPVLARAGECFTIATNGAFTGLTIAYGDDDTPRIAAQRADDTSVPMSGLSEGSADQLYLALRIATIEDFARRATPLPFIADDLFVSFDDARTEAALRLLQDFGATTQAIVFTHHSQVVDCARRAVGDTLQVVEL